MTTFAHLTLATRDVARTIAFFEATLGWKPVKHPANTPLEAGWMDIGPRQQLHVLRVADFTPSPFEREFGRHFAIFYPGAGFGELKRRLKEHGGELIDPIRGTPFERFFFRDPNGYVFEVIDEQHYVRES